MNVLNVSEGGRGLILGATGGIGAHLTRSLAEQGWSLALAARGEERLSALAQEVDAWARPTDVTDPEAVDALFGEAVETLGGLDAVAHCVGSMLLSPAHLTTEDQWTETLEINLTSAFRVVRAAGRHMKQGGSVVLVASAAARIGLANHEAVAAAKAGIVGLARAAAATYASRGLRVNVVSPGLVRTPLTEAITSNERALEASRSMHPLGRIGDPEDVASVLAFLMGGGSRWMSGEVLAVDGGLSTLKSIPSKRRARA